MRRVKKAYYKFHQTHHLRELASAKSWVFDPLYYDWRCSCCGFSPEINDKKYPYNYPKLKECPNCKSKMRDEVNVDILVKAKEVPEDYGEPVITDWSKIKWQKGFFESTFKTDVGTTVAILVSPCTFTFAKTLCQFAEREDSQKNKIFEYDIVNLTLRGNQTVNAAVRYGNYKNGNQTSHGWYYNFEQNGKRVTISMNDTRIIYKQIIGNMVDEINKTCPVCPV